MALAFEPDQKIVKMKQQAKYLGISFQSYCSNTHRHTHSRTQCSTWTTKVVGKTSGLKNLANSVGLFTYSRATVLVISTNKKDM